MVFYVSTGVLLFVSLPLTRFPPHIGFLGILSLITAYSILFKRIWTPWLMFILLITTTVFSLYTLYFVGFSNMLVALSMIVYPALTWIVTVLILLKKET